MADQLWGAGTSRPTNEFNVSPCFMPDEDCVAKVVEWIGYAEELIVLQAYSFSSRRIFEALISAKGRGVAVVVLIDRDADRKRGNLIPHLQDRGIPVEVDEQGGRSHNKIVIIDNKRVVTGSYNWTDDDFYHDSDVVLFIKDACVNRLYYGNIAGNPIQRDGVIQPGKINCCNFNLFDFEYSINEDNDRFTTVASKQTKRKQKGERYVEVEPCFTPGRDCMKLIVECIASARKSILIQASSLTYKRISDALIRAHERGINVRLLVNENTSEDEGQKIRDIVQAGIPVKCDIIPGGIAHSKTIIIDDDIVFIGSLNLTYSGQNRNSENLVRIRNTRVNSMCRANFERRYEAEFTQFFVIVGGILLLSAALAYLYME